MTALAGLIIAMLVTAVAMRPMMRVAPRWRLLDIPDVRKVHAREIPRVGGIAMVAGILVAIALAADIGREQLAWAAASLVIIFFGVWDDRQDLDFRIKFLGQITAACLLIGWGGITVHRMPFLGDVTAWPWMSAALTLWVLLATTNAINLADGLDGLAAGLSLLSFATVGVIAVGHGDMGAVVIATCIIGGIFGFLRYNTHPARVFMGDGGSQFLGFALGALLIKMTDSIYLDLSPATQFWLIGLPLLDTAMVMGGRFLRGVSPFRADRTHFHHILIASGFSHSQTVVVAYGLQLAMLASGLLLYKFNDSFVFTLYLAWFVVFVTIARYLPTVRPLEFFKLKRFELKPMKKSAPRIIAMMTAFFLSSFWLTTSMLAEPVKIDLSVVSALFLVLLAIGSLVFRRRTFFGSLEKLVWYMLVVFCVYLNHEHLDRWLATPSGLLAIFCIGLLVIVGLFQVSRVRLRPTATDLLVVVAVVAVGVVSWASQSSVGHVAGYALVTAVLLFYATEVASYGRASDVALMRVAGLFSLGALSLRGLLM